MRRGALITLLIFFAPVIVSGGIVFTEIMYDFPGTEGGGEHDWVEIKNTGSQSVDISAYKFFEANTNHGLKPERGGTELQPGAFAVISNSTTTFLADWPNFNGVLFDSSFSLNSNGELLKICNNSCSAEGSVIEDSITYVPMDSATNNGSSIQKDSSGNWVATLPTPGSGLPDAPENNQSENVPPSDNNADNNTAVTPQSVSDTVSSPNIEPQVFADAGKDRVVITGAAAIFEGKAYGLKKEPLENARYVWNFGDGSVKEGKVVEHTYRYPGDYWVALEVASGYFSGGDRAKVRAEISPLKISSITDGTSYFVEIYNSSNSDMDISLWWLASGDKTFEIPKNTFVMGGKKLVFANEVTGLSVTAGSVPELRYPNGMPAVRFGENAITYQKAASPPEGNTTAPPVKTAKAEAKNNSDGREAKTASAVNSAEGKKGNSYIWLSGVVLMSALAIGGLVLLRRQETGARDSDRLAEEIEIVEN